MAITTSLKRAGLNQAINYALKTQKRIYQNCLIG